MNVTRGSPGGGTMSRLLSLFLFLTSINAYAESVVLSPTTMAEHAIEGIPTYFFKPSPDGRYFAYTFFRNHGANKQTNHILDTQTNEVVPIPGAYDPTFLLSDRGILTPGNGGMAFYEIGELKKRKSKSSSMLLDSSMQGVYPSVARLEQGEGYSIYRVLVENNGRYYRDYKESISSDGKMKSFDPISEKKALCTNYRFSLPMISKQGREFGGLDYEAGVSRVYSLNEDGTCDVALDLNVLTGKIAFSYDSRFIAFHVFTSPGSVNLHNYIEVPPTTTAANIVVYDRETQTSYTLTQYEDANAMYPEFLLNGHIVFVLHPHDDTKKVKFVHLKANIPGLDLREAR